MGESTAEPDRLSPREVRRRAKQSVVIVGLRGVGLRVLQLGGLLVLGRLLAPQDFGAVALGLVFVGIITVTSQAGIGATLIRRSQSPSRAELGTLLGFQLGVATALARPVVSRPILRGLLPFGLRLQAIDFVNLVREQGLNVGIAAIGGLATLGAWSFAYRIMQMPYILFTTLWRVSFPAMSRLVEAKEDMKPLLERGVALTAVATGAILVPLTASAPAAIPAILGEGWHEVPDVVPWASLGLMIGGPISVAVAGYLYAIGDARTPLRATLAHTAVWLVVAL